MINFESIEPFVIGLMAFAFLMAVMLGIARLAERLSSGLHVFGNVVTGPVSTVTLAVAREPGRSATGSTTSVAAVNGVASVTSETLTAGAAAASQSVLQQSPTTGTAGQALSTAVKVAVTDAFGNVVTSDTSTVAIAVASGPGGFAVGSTTSVAAVNGVATFSNLILDAAGSYTLSLSDGTLTGATTGTISTSPAAASQLVLKQSPTSGTAGVALGALKVVMKDAFGNVVSTDSSTMKVAVATGPGGFAAGSTTSMSAAGGVATFSNLILDTAGSYTLSLSDGTLTGARTGTISISPASASQLVLQQAPTSGTTGVNLGALKVAVEDAFGNVVTSDSSRVTVAVASGPGGFAAGSTTSMSVTSGVATFSNLILDTAGSYTLSLSDGTLTGATTGAITISPASASQLVLQQAPTNGTAGLVLTPSVTVAVEDRFGNVLTSDTSTLTIAVASGPGGFAAGSTTSVAAVNGVATFANLVLNTSGSYTLKATNGTLTSLTSETLTVGAAAASQLVLQQSPTTGTAGQALSTTVKVAVADSFGNVITTDAFVCRWDRLS